MNTFSCIVSWEHSLTSNLSRNRLQMTVESKDLLNFNITSTLTELYKHVKDSWIQDYYSAANNSKSALSPPFRRRPPFIPFALKNDTGSVITYTTLVTENDCDEGHNLEANWFTVGPGQVIPFTFKSHGKNVL